MNRKLSYWDHLVGQISKSFEIIELASLLLLPGILLSLLLALTFSLIHVFRVKGSKRGLSSFFGGVVVLSLVAFVVGLVSANSRESVIGDILPILISGFGALLVYSHIKGQLTKYVAAVAAITFSLTLFVGLITGSQIRGDKLFSGQIEQFSAVSHVPNQKSGHRADLVSINATLGLVKRLRADKKVSEEYQTIIDYVALVASIRRSFHIQHAYETEEMQMYRVVKKQYPNLDGPMIESLFDGEKRKMLSDIHYHLKPLESIKQ